MDIGLLPVTDMRPRPQLPRSQPPPREVAAGLRLLTANTATPAAIVALRPFQRLVAKRAAR